MSITPQADGTVDRNREMSQIRSILFIPLTEDTECPADFDDAVDFAESFGAGLTIFDALPDLTKAEREATVGLQPSATGLARSALRAVFASWAERVHERLPVQVDVAIGRRPLEIAQRVKRDGHDLVIVAAGRSSFNNGTIRRLLRVCPCAVLIMRTPVTSANVVVAIDPFDPVEFNRSILEVARAHTRRNGSCLHIVHAWMPDGLHIMMNNAGKDDLDPAHFVSRIESEHREALRELLDQYEADSSTTVHFYQGSPAEAILETAANITDVMIVIGSCGPHGAETLVVGKTTEQLISATGCSVMIVRPPGLATRR